MHNIGLREEGENEVTVNAQHEPRKESDMYKMRHDDTRWYKMGHDTRYMMRKEL